MRITLVVLSLVVAACSVKPVSFTPEGDDGVDHAPPTCTDARAAAARPTSTAAAAAGPAPTTARAPIGFGLIYGFSTMPSHGAGFLCASSECSHGAIDAGGNGLLSGR